MAPGLFLAFLFLTLLVSCLVADQEENPPSRTSCPKAFHCRDLGPLRFPFTNISRPGCGLCPADCEPARPKIKFSRFSDQTFDGISVLNNSIKLRDLQLQRLLQEKSCSTFYYEINLPNSSQVSFRIVSNNIALFRCSSYPRLSQEIIDWFQSYGYRSYTSCDGFQVFYRNPKYYPSQNEHLSPGCSSIHLPMLPWDSVSKESELFNLLSSEFDLQWHLKAGKDKSIAIIIAVAAIAGIALLNVLVIFLIWRCKKQNQNSRHLCTRPGLEDGSSYLGIPVFSYAELEDITNNFDASKELGDGGYGTVYYGKLLDGREVAVKRLYEHNFKRMRQFKNEVEILTRLRHPNLVTLYGCCASRESREQLLVYEYILNGTVADHLHGDRAKDQPLKWPVRMKIAIETAGALAYLHASDIIHRDVKTNNILLDHNFQVKVADFGLSRLFPDYVSHISTAPQGTPGYVDPEYHHCYQLTDKSDVYSFGVVLIELVSSMPAVDKSRNRYEINLANLALNRIQRCELHGLIDPSLGFDSDFEVLRMTTSVAELAFRCLQLEKEMRPTMDEVLKSLIAIQDPNEILEETTETNANTIERRTTMLNSSPESDDVVLLKRDAAIPFSPKSVTDLCLTSSSET